MCPVWFSNGGMKTGQKFSVIWSKNLLFSNGQPNQVIRLFGNQAKKCPKNQMFGFQVFGIQMVTVLGLSDLKTF